jgi:hypothetical protein
MTAVIFPLSKCPFYVGDLLKLAFLSPKIIDLIVAGRQPEELVADHLICTHDLPLDWADQARRLNIHSSQISTRSRLWLRFVR